MLRGDDLRLFVGGCDEGSPGEVVCSAEEAARALLYGGDGWFGEEVLFDAGDFEVVQEVGLHVLQGDTSQMASGHHPGGQGQGGAVDEQIGEVVLPGENDWEHGVGATVKLGDGVQLGEDLQPEQGSLFDTQDGLFLSLLHALSDELADEPGEHGPGEAGGVQFQGGAYLPVELQDGALRGGDPNWVKLRGVQSAAGPPQGSGLSTAHVSGDQGDCAQADGVVKPFGHSFDLRHLHDLFGSQVRSERLPAES